LVGSLWAGGGCGKLVVRNNADDENGLAGFDFVAGGEHRLFDLRAVELGTIGAAFVDDAAAVGTAFDGEVNAGHVIVVGNGELGAIGGAANEEGLVS